MNRFRKRSDAKRSGLPDSLHDSDGVLELPPVSNFRTSLILPDLARRFSLLRTASGNPLSLNDLRTRFAEQRARGAENQITEEEEDMILGELDRIRSDNAKVGQNPFGLNSSRTFNVPSTDRQSFRSTDAPMSSPVNGRSPLPSPPRYVKRHSNNLFGSGRFRDDTYFRSVIAQRTGTQRGAVTAAHTDSSVSIEANESTSYANSLRPTTPETLTSLPSSAQSTPEKAGTPTDSLFMPNQPFYPEPAVSAPDYRISSPNALRRASLALVEVFKEIEEEVEDEIVMPRSTPPSRAVVVGEQAPPLGEMNDSAHGNIIQTGMAISSDKETVLESGGRSSPVAYTRSGTTSPTPRLPGYIPGMPRPMTPRAADAEEQLRSLSTTPRAASPHHLPNFTGHTSPNVLSGLLRRGSDAQTSRLSQRPTSPSSSSPFYLPRIPNGSILSEIERGGDSFSIDINSSFDSSVLGRRRPASPPLSGSDYRPVATSPRPGTPSNITWNVLAGPNSPNNNTQADTSESNTTHRRQASWISDSAAVADIPSLSVSSKSNIRSSSSQVSADSPLVERANWNGSVDPLLADKRSSATKDNIDFAVPPFTSRIPRSPTPTQNAPQSPTASTFSIYDLSPANSPRSSKQTAPNTPFSLGSFHPFVFSPLANSSRSSLESAGSSYHSWEGGRKDPGVTFFTDSGTPQSVWHDISTATDKHSSAIAGETLDGSDAEGTIGQYAGLTKFDFLAIQEKLVGVANSAPDVRERVPSLRRRRPSTSQSNYSVSGREAKVGSPLPRSLSPITTPQNDKSLKGTALLDSVLDSIRSPQTPILDIPIDDKLTAAIRSDTEPSPTTRRNRDLAQALFGVQEPSTQDPPTQPSTGETVAKTVDGGNNVRRSPSPESTDSSAETTEVAPTSQYEPQLDSQLANADVTSTEQDDLVVEVQRKTDAAMIALKRGPSLANFERGGVSGSISRRRVNPGQISTPRLVSATTSVDTIPLRSPSVASGNIQGSSRFGQRFRRLTGTLRPKPNPYYTEDSVADSPNPQSPLSSQVATYDPASFVVPGPPVLSSATEAGAFKVPIPSPPASAGPGLKGFMARFRKRGTMDATQDPSFRGSYQNSPFTTSARASTPLDRNATITRNTYEPVQRDDSPSRYPPSQSVPEPPGAVFATKPVTPVPAVPSSDADDSALKQLFAAANDLGLDQEALNELLARSGSIRQKPNASETRATNGAIANTEMPPPTSAPSPPPDPRSSTDSRPNDTKLSVRKAPDQTRRPRPVQDENTAAVNAIVRRTIIYPSESRSSTIDLNILMRKHSQSIRHRRSTSSNSTSARSVHDRVPTPPPPRSSTSKRFSTDNSPPVPQLPFSYASLGDSQSFSKSAPAGPIEQSSSTYDSLYEMYTGDNKASAMASSESHVLNPVQSSQNADSDHLPAAESGPALEVLEMANGETIWSIVNGLRDDDAESLWANRTSFASEYSLRESNGVNGVQVSAKEQGRKNNSNPSFLSRKKSQGRSHPETKVFYSSSAQIGRLIENLSQGKDAGSFNFVPHSNRGHSHSSSLQSESDIQWTVEERLEYMLGSIGRA